MIHDRHYSPIIATKVKALVSAEAYEELTAYLSSLSNSSFRTAGYVIGERVMPALEASAFYTLFDLLYGFNAKAFLVTLLKPLAQRITDGSLTLHDESLGRILATIRTNDIDRQKTLQHLLPVLTKPDDMELLLRMLDVTDPRQRIAFLLRCPTLPSYFVLLHTLHFIEHDHAFLVRTAHHLIKTDPKYGFNMASLLRCLFDLTEVKGTFSLTLQPYQLSHIEGSFPAFCETMCS